MLVKNWMSKNVITIDADDSMNMAIKMMKQYKIKVLPVMENGQMIGILSDGDIKRASASEATTLDVYELAYLLDQLKIRDIMTRNVITISALLTIDEVAELLLEKNISSVPVLDENKKIVGIITKTDILKVLISLTGMQRRGVDFGFEVADEPGSIKMLTDQIRSYGGRISSILISYEQAAVGFRNVYIRIYQIDNKQLMLLKKQLLQMTKILYCLDFLGKQREIF
jgi:acetoin utilization protein AcuB